MKRGFRLADGVAPTKAEYFSAGEDLVDRREKELYADIPDADWCDLAPGFGRALSSIYVEEDYRPNSADKAAIDPDDKREIYTVLTEIYRRF